MWPIEGDERASLARLGRLDSSRVGNVFGCPREAGLMGQERKSTQGKEKPDRQTGRHETKPCVYWSKVDFLLGFWGGGRRRIRTFVGVSQQIYSLPSLTA